MNKKYKININQRYLFKKLEKNRLILKILINNLFIKKKIRYEIEKKWFFLKNQKSSLTKIKNICILTGRSKSIHKLFKISRIQLRLLASKGFIPGVSKFSW